jgi:ABC-type branched-subunit amino acid transport system ATPase component
VHDGEIVGLIGPNGAGKTTLMNVISGAVTPDDGEVSIGNVDMNGLAPELRFSFGLGRTFQHAELFPGLTVVETMQVATSHEYRTGFVASAFATPLVRQAESRSREAALATLERFGLSEWAQSLTSDLSTGSRRICDLAVQVAAKPRLMLLDEPTAGVAQREAEAFGPLLRSIRDELSCSILIIEHDMPLLMSVCDRVYAMEAGQIIAAGTPADVRNDPAVIASYLGSDTRAIDRSGPTVPPASPAPDRPVRKRPLRAGAPVEASPSASANGSATAKTPAKAKANTAKAKAKTDTL